MLLAPLAMELRVADMGLKGLHGSADFLTGSPLASKGFPSQSNPAASSPLVGVTAAPAPVPPAPPPAELGPEAPAAAAAASFILAAPPSMRPATPFWNLNLDLEALGASSGISSSRMGSPARIRSSCCLALACPFRAECVSSPIALNTSVPFRRESKMAWWYCALALPFVTASLKRASPFDLSCATPRPSMYMPPSWYLALLFPCSLENWYCCAAFASSFTIPPDPFSYISASSLNASATWELVALA
mmetsp:Transcript_67367/g.152433  ORF Transcript_67367/g.152433 Transcript_67367/m.152433 type:complete len:247 (-) Transcript_67367:759-1499(-)